MQERLKSYSERKAEEYEDEFHKDYPNGMTVADYCNREVPSVAFEKGFTACAELMQGLVEALEKAAYQPLTDDTAFCVEKKLWINSMEAIAAREALSTLEKKLEER